MYCCACVVFASVLVFDVVVLSGLGCPCVRFNVVAICMFLV